MESAFSLEHFSAIAADLDYVLLLGQPVEVARAPGVNRRQSAHKTATHISVDLVIVLFRVDVTCHTSRVTVTRHNVCCI